MVQNDMGMQDSLTKSNDGIVAGVCQGLAEHLDIAVGWLRLAWLLSVVFLGTGLLVYIILAISLPSEGQLEKNKKKMLLGACLKLANKMEWDVGVVRACFALLFLISGGSGLLIYLLLAIALPNEKKINGSTIIDL